MKKRKILLSSFVLFALCVTGCNRNNNADAPSNNDKASISEVHNDTSALINPTSEVKSSSEPVSSGNKTSNNNSEVHTHTWGEWQTVKAATCTEAGSEKRVCSGCGESETRATNALGHNFGNFVTTKEATCTEAGEQKKTRKTASGESRLLSRMYLSTVFGWMRLKLPTHSTNNS